MSRYVPPAKRAPAAASKAAEPIISLSPDNFPEFISVPPKSISPRSASSLNFSNCFKVVEKDDDTRKSYPGGISPSVRAKMIEEGWEFLSLSVTKEPGFCERWNTKMAFVPPEDDGWFGTSDIIVEYTQYDDTNDAASYQSESSSEICPDTEEYETD
jgi:hypothetical protein